MQGDEVRIARAHEMAPVSFRKKRKRRQKAQWVGIPARKIKVGSYIEMFEVGEAGHEIMGDRPPGRKLTQNVDLKPLKFPDHVRAEASEIQGVCGVGVSRSAIRQLDLIEVPVFHAPEHIAPSFVQARDGFIPLSKPLTKSDSDCGRERNGGVMTAVLVVDLPRMDCRMVADRLRQLRFAGI